MMYDSITRLIVCKILLLAELNNASLHSGVPTSLAKAWRKLLTIQIPARQTALMQSLTFNPAFALCGGFNVLKGKA
jgi:hypothetical protein